MLQGLHRAICAMGLGLALTLPAAPLAAHAPQITPQQAQQTAPLTGQVRFDWRANRPAAPAGPLRAGRFGPAKGRGSYICSPAGSGQMSRCHAR